MVSLPRKRNATYADIEAAPENMIAEIIGGDLSLLPRPSGPHGQAASTIGIEVGSAFHLRRGGRGPGGWIIHDEPELHVARILPDVYVPDLAGWRREHMPRVQDDHRYRVVPDWVCEVVSPKKRHHDLMVKGARYLNAGVPWFWLVEPLRRTVDCYEARDGTWVTAASFEGHAKVRIPPFDAVELDLSEWWVEDAEQHRES